MTFSEDDNVLVQGVENDKDALGYFGYAYYRGGRRHADGAPGQQGPERHRTRRWPRKAKGCVAPTEETINDNSYPLSRPLFIYVAKEALAEAASARTSWSSTSTNAGTGRATSGTSRCRLRTTKKGSTTLESD